MCHSPCGGPLEGVDGFQQFVISRGQLHWFFFYVWFFRERPSNADGRIAMAFPCTLYSSSPSHSAVHREGWCMSYGARTAWFNSRHIWLCTRRSNARMMIWIVSAISIRSISSMSKYSSINLLARSCAWRTIPSRSAKSLDASFAACNNNGSDFADNGLATFRVMRGFGQRERQAKQFLNMNFGSATPQFEDVWKRKILQGLTEIRRKKD